MATDCRTAARPTAQVAVKLAAPDAPPTPLQMHLADLGVGGFDPFILTLRQSAKKCEATYATTMCGCNLQSGPLLESATAAVLHEPSAGLSALGRLAVIRVGACMSLDCIPCHQDVSRRRGDRAKQRLDAGRNGDAVGEAVFTVPPRKRGPMIDRKTWLVYRREAWRILQLHAGARFGFGCSHPIGDKNPDLFHPHVHFVFCGPRGFKGHLSNLALDKMRLAWADVLKVRLVDIHYSYVRGDEPGRIYHRCRYVARSFPGFGAWCGAVAWFGAYPKGLKFASFKDCRDCGKARLIIGTATLYDYEQYKAGNAPRIPPWLFNPSARLPRPPPPKAR